jgi:hypothetical protein
MERNTNREKGSLVVTSVDFKALRLPSLPEARRYHIHEQPYDQQTPPSAHHTHNTRTHTKRRDMPGRAGGQAGEDGAKLADPATTTGGCALTVLEAVLGPSAMGWLENKYRRLVGRAARCVDPLAGRA